MIEAIRRLAGVQQRTPAGTSPRSDAWGTGPENGDLSEQTAKDTPGDTGTDLAGDPIGEEMDSSLGDLLVDHEAVSPSQSIISLNLREQTAALLRTLRPKEAEILRMRFGLLDDRVYTLEEVGRHFAVTRERIRQLEAKALRKLRASGSSHQLRVFLESGSSG
jgi:RNA polymerase sigma factor (sigma-70 family)